MQQMRLLCLDIDDCIFQNDNTYVGRTDDSLDVLEMNLKRLVMIINKFNLKIFITSSWYSILKLEDNKLSYLNYDMIVLDKDLYKHEYFGYLLIKKYLEKYIVGMSCGNRRTDIKNLLEQNNKIVALDDINLSNIESLTEEQQSNYLYIETTGFITNLIIFQIDKFFRD